MALEVQLQNLSEMGKNHDDRPVWDKFPEEGDDELRAILEEFSPNPKPKKASVLWQTTNSEYGRFQRSGSRDDGIAGSRLPTDAGVTRSLGLLGSSRSCRDPAASARSRAESLSQSQYCLQTGQGEAAGTPSTSGIRLPSLDPKYMPLRGLDAATDAERKRLTTGYAKSYMRQSHAPFWRNIQTLAPDAGLDVSRPDTQILTIERQETNNEIDSAYLDELMMKYRDTNDDTQGQVSADIAATENDS